MHPVTRWNDYYRHVLDVNEDVVELAWVKSYQVIRVNTDFKLTSAMLFNTLQMEIDIVVIRQSMLPELYAGHLWKEHHGSTLLLTASVNQMDDQCLAMISDKSVLIVGHYYANSMDSIIEVAKSVTVFVSIESAIKSTESCRYITSDKYTGFLTWTIQQLGIQQQHIIRIGQYLDQYFYGYPCEEAVCFRNEIFMIDKLLAINDEQEVDTLVINGRTEMANNEVLKGYLRTAKEVDFTIGNNTYTALVGIGDIYVGDGCWLLAHNSTSGIGMLFRYDLSQNKTSISIRTTQKSGIHAGALLKKLVGGGGYPSMAGGSISKLLFPEQLLY